MALNMDDAAARHPGSYPFLLVDKVLGMESARRAIGLHNVTANDPLLAYSYYDRANRPKANKAPKGWRGLVPTPANLQRGFKKVGSNLNNWLDE